MRTGPNGWLFVLSLILAPGITWAVGPPPRTGVIEGEVRFTGKLPPARKLSTMDGFILHNDLVVDKKTKGLRDVAVSLVEPPAAPALAGKLEPVYVDQKDLLFVPRVVAVRAGQVVRFDNSDHCNHGVQATSSVKRNTFNLFVTSGKPIDRTFEAQKHPIALTCQLHPWMKGYVYAFDHPYYSLTGEKGTFRIEGMKPGKYTLLFRHADSGLNEKREVNVRVGKAARVVVEWTKVPDE